MATGEARFGADQDAADLHAAGAPSADRDAWTIVSDLRNRLRSHDGASPRTGPGRREPAEFGWLDAREAVRWPSTTDPWPPGLVAVAKLAAALTLMIAVVYGPPYYTCRQMKAAGMFYSGTTVRSCVRDGVSDRYEAVETFLQRVARRA